MRIRASLIKFAATVMAAVMTAVCIPVLAAQADVSGSDAIENNAIESEAFAGIEDYVYSGKYTDEEINNDPGFLRLSGLASMKEDQEAEESGAAPTEGSSQTGSPFIKNTYTHNDAHDNYLILNGVDISHYQESIDWNAARRAGVSFAIVRIGYRGYKYGNLVEDTYYKTNLTKAPEAGVNTGVYVYSQAITKEEAIEEADFVLSRIKGYKVTLPVVFDYEYADTGLGRLWNAHLSKDQATQVCLAFCDRVKEAGYEAMVYANKSMLTDSLNAYQITGAGYKVWLAHYTVKSSYAGEYDYWQYTSKGSVSGIPGYVDCNFWYVFVEASDIRLSQSSVTMEAGSTYKLTASLTPSNATNAISWSSSDTGVAAVSSDGTITGVNTGTAVITATVGSLSAKCTVTVTVPPVHGVMIEKELYETAVGATFTINAHVVPETADNRLLHWSSDAPDVAEVDEDGRVKALAVGTAKITVTTDEGGYTATAEVRVLERVMKIELDQQSITLMNGTEHKAVATITPDNAEWDIEWSSSNELVATVDQEGVITARGIGTAVITASAGDISAEMEVEVTGRTVTLRTLVRLSGVEKYSAEDLSLRLTSLADSDESYAPGHSPSTGGTAFTFEAYEGEYELSIRKPGFTSYIERDFTVGTNTFPSMVVLFPGDVNGDGYVNVRDIAVERSLMGITSDGSSYTTAADLNDDGVIDKEDFELLLKGYGQFDNIIE